VSRFPVAFGLPAFASRSSDSRRGVGPSSRSAYRARDRARTPTGLPRSARTSCDRGGCPLYPEDGGALPGLRDALSWRLPLCRGQSFDPAPASHRQGSASRGIDEGSSDSPVRSSPCLWPPGWNGPPLGFPLSFAPRRPGAGRRTSRWGQAVEHGPGTTLYDISRTSNPACSLVSCDLASHRPTRASVEGLSRRSLVARINSVAFLHARGGLARRRPRYWHRAAGEDQDEAEREAGADRGSCQ
jgi:hypothetical protein